MKTQLSILTFSALLMAACGGSPGSSSPASPAAPIGKAMPSVRCLLPADLDADGRADVIAPPTLNRLLIQAPSDTPISITLDGQRINADIFKIETDNGRYLHEVHLPEAIKQREVKVTAGEYVLFFSADTERASIGPCTLTTFDKGLANDLSAPEGFYFEDPSDVSFRVSGALPSMAFDGLQLRANSQSSVDFKISLDHFGLVLKPVTTPRSGVIYRLASAKGALDAFGGKFQSRVKVLCGHPSSDEALKVVLADLNRDGQPEVAALYADGSVATITSTQGAADYLLKPSGLTGIDLCAGDVDGNGADDLVTLDRSSSGYRLTYFLNKTQAKGERFLIESLSIETQAPIACVCADFDRDGKTDTAVLDAFGDVHIFSRGSKVAVFAAFEQRRLCSSITCSDTDGDGKPDLTVLAANGEVSRLLNKDGKFEPANNSLVDVSPCNRVVSGNLNGDLGRDLVFSGQENSFIALAGKTNDFNSYQLAVADETVVSGVVAIVDVNKDSRDDLLVIKEETGGTGTHVAVFLNSPDSKGRVDSLIPLGVRVRVHDMLFWNGAMIYATSAGLLTQDVDSEVMPPSADSPVRFIKAYSPVPRIPAPLAAAIADLNDDGRADLAAVGADGFLRVWVSGEAGEPFKAIGKPVDLGGDGKLKAIDFDRDNSPDLLYIPYDTSRKPRILRNRGGGEFDTNDNGLLPTPPTGLQGAPALGDFDRDGDLDVLWPSPLGRLQYNDSGRWRDYRDPLEVRDSKNMRLHFSGELCCADFTGDGIADVVAVMQAGEEAGVEQVLVLLKGTGDTEQPPFISVISHEIRGRIFDLSPADFNGDGRLDLALGVALPGQDAKLMLLQLGQKSEFVSFDGSPTAKGKLNSLALDDIDRDGDLDLIASEIVNSRGQLTLWVNMGKGKFSEADKAQASLERAMGDFSATNLSLADFTGDGRSDLLAIDKNGNVVIVRTTLP